MMLMITSIFWKNPMLTYHFSTSGFQKTNVKLSALTSVVEKPMLTNIIYNYAITFLLASVF